MFRRLAGRPERLDDLERVEALVRGHFALAPDDLVLAGEARARQPGFPPEETLVRFWRGPDRYRLRLFKPAARVGPADLPPRFLLPALRDEGEPDCC